MDIVKAVVALVAAASAVAVLAALAAKSPPQANGWRHLRPGPMYWTGVLLGGGLTLLMAYVRLFVGSSRLDGATQMAILTCLILAFGFMTAATAVQLVRLQQQAIRWRGQTIAHASASGEARHEMADIVEMRSKPLGHIVLRFSDGTQLPIDPYATTAADMLERIEELRAS